MEERTYTESELIDPALYEINKYEQGLTTGQLIKLLTNILNPTGKDAEIIPGRNDTYFSQKVRNLISHKSIYPIFTNYDAKASLIKINDCGKKRLFSSEYYINHNRVSEDDELDFDGDEDLSSPEDLTDFINSNKKIISCEPLNYSVFDLKRRYDKRSENDLIGSLILDETFQRNKVWTRKQKSQLIESLLLGIPIPYLYLYEDKNANLIVLDGRQRLSAIFDYLENQYSLTNMEFLQNLEGKKITDLTDNLVDKLEKIKAKIEDSHLHVIKIGYETPEIFKMKIFARVNQNGTKLNNQELRHALHQGPITQILKELSENVEVLTSKNAKQRMKDRYLILRYIAMRLYMIDELKYYKNSEVIKHVDYIEINTFLANAMDAINTFSDIKLKEIKTDFLECWIKAQKLLGNTAFRLDSKAPINMILFETTLSFISLSKNKGLSNEQIINMINDLRTIRSDEIDVNGNTPFFQNIKYHRDSKENFLERIMWMKDILSKYKGE